MRKKKRLIKRPKNSYKKESRVIRLSPEVDKMIKSLGKRGEPYDNILRRLLGLPTNKYQEAAAKDFWVVVEQEANSRIFDNEAEANGRATLLAVRDGKKKPFPVVKLRSVL